MPFRYEHRWFTPAMCREEPAALFVFGDNLRRAGRGGQAVIRDEPNAVGIPTKRAPSWDDGAFFTDGDLEAFRGEASAALARLRAHAEAGGQIIWPWDGIGTGRAQLAQRAPRIWAALERARKRLEAIASQGGNHV